MAVAREEGGWLAPARTRSATLTAVPTEHPERYAPAGTDDLTAKAASIYQTRRQRSRFFGEDADLFGEPAWDILLDLYVRIRQGQLTTVNSVCHASGVPSTTAARWVETLVQRGLIVKTPHPDDKRCSLVWLTEEAMRALTRLLAEA